MDDPQRTLGRQVALNRVDARRHPHKTCLTVVTDASKHLLSVLFEARYMILRPRPCWPHELLQAVTMATRP